jgi:hypothetical protein
MLGSIVVAIVLFWVGTTPLHVTTKHRSGCPAVTTDTFTALLDPLGTVAVTRELDVCYDVCGLPEGTHHAVRLGLSRRARGLRGVFGGRSSRVTVSYEETARGPATRRHRPLRCPAWMPAPTRWS